MATAPSAPLSVLLPLPLAGPYDYSAPPGSAFQPGDFVEVPFGSRRLYGVVWGPGRGDVAAAKLKPICRRLDVPPMVAVTRRFIDWVAGYTVSPSGAVLRMAMSVTAALEPPRAQTLYTPSDTPPTAVRLTAARRRVLAFLDGLPPLEAADIGREAGVGSAVIKGMATAGLLRALTVRPEAGFPVPDLTRPGPALSDAQARAAAGLAARIGAGYSTTLLDGVTGSGKTEVYFEAVHAALAHGHQVLVLLPEIALSAQWLERFRHRFGVAPALWHSELTPARRRDTWRAVAGGRAPVVVGARSALFLPFADLGLVVVDEEHEHAFKQEDGVHYHARDMAVVRARLGDIPAILASATPSLETLANVGAARYGREHLPERHGGAVLPAVTVIDIRQHRPARQSWIAPPLAEALAETFAAGQQAMLFLNRRGYAPLTLCRHCGHRFQCPHCSTWLVEHRAFGRLQCHHCGHSQRRPEVCPECGEAGTLAACGPGVERLYEEALYRFPDLRAEIVTSDTLTGPKAAAELVARMAAHELDLLIGTQILAKGYHFPDLTLVGVVDADLGLAGGDLRAAERSYQMLAQVAGRAGRGATAGRVLLQTAMPDHAVIAALAAGDRDGFLAAEMDQRRRHAMPPFGRLAALVVSGRDEARVDGVAFALARSAPRHPEVTVLGPAPAPLALLRGRHRRRLLVKAARSVRLQPLLAAWVGGQRLPSQVRVSIDVDPYSFL